MSLASALVWHHSMVRRLVDVIHDHVEARAEGVLDLVDAVSAQLDLEERLIEAGLIADPDPGRRVYRRARLALFRLVTADVTSRDFPLHVVELRAILELRAQHHLAAWVHAARGPAPARAPARALLRLTG